MNHPEERSGAGRDGNPSSRLRASAHTRGLLITVAGVVLLSPDALIIRSIDTDQWTLLFWRGVLVAATLWAVVLVRARIGRGVLPGRPGPTEWVVAVSWGGAILLFVISLSHTAVANTLVILSASPLFTAMLSRPVLGEPVGRRTWAAVVLVTGAVGLIFSGSLEQGHLPGDLAALGGAFSMAVCFVALRRGRAISMLPAIATAHVLVAVVTAPMAAPLSLAAGDMWLLAFAGTIQLPLAVGLIVTGPRYVPAPEVRLLGLIETVLGPLWVWWGRGETPAAEVALAAAVILPTLAVHSILSLRRPRDQARPRLPREQA